MYNFGFIKSKLDGTEHIYSAPEGFIFPETFSCIPNLPEVINQGEYSICVPCSISTYINWRASLEDGEPKDLGVKLFDIYNSKTTQGEGMTFKDAFHFLRHKGVETKKGIEHINQYSMIKGGVKSVQSALIENGPCVGALPVRGQNYGDDPEFWQKEKGSLLGGHAISIVGYTPEGFIIRNSWGKHYCENGYTLLKYKDFHYLIEVWTVVG